MIKIIQKVSPNTRTFTSSCVQHSEIARYKMQKWKAGSENVYLTQAEEVIKSHEVSHVL
jgi:hypothetical protein